jgi:hypothetical protein
MADNEQKGQGQEKHSWLRKLGFGKDDAGMEVKDPNPEISKESDYHMPHYGGGTQKKQTSDPFDEDLNKSSEAKGSGGK